MPILGAGTDIVEISRIKDALTESFMARYFTENERALIEKQGAKTAACNFSAKEALVKALGTGFNGIAPIDIETLRDENGKPYINLYGTAKRVAESQGVKRVHVSLSHGKDAAVAFVILEY